MPIGNAHKYRPEYQARIQANMQNPEWVRRRAMWKAATGKRRKWITAWNHAYSLAGWPAVFPDFEEWKAEKRRTASEFEITMIER